jgi:ribokinase
MPNPPYVYILGSLVVACSAKVPRLPVEGESLAASAFTLEIGGKGFNLALGATRLGGAVRGLLPYGDDLLGDIVELIVAESGIPGDMLRQFPGKTGSGIGFADSGGHNTLAIFAGVNQSPMADHIQADKDAISGAALVAAQFELGDAAICEGFAIARSAGVATLLNPSPFRPIPPGILSSTSIMLVNEIEAADLAGQLGIAAPENAVNWARILPDLAAALSQHGPDTLIVTLGEDGVLAISGDEPQLFQAAFRVKAVDALGAGDAFAAGFATSLVEGRPLAEALRRGSACGALAATKLGVYDALPGLNEVEALIA